jgi:hypothetical protein
MSLIAAQKRRDRSNDLSQFDGPLKALGVIEFPSGSLLDSCR